MKPRDMVPSAARPEVGDWAAWIAVGLAVAYFAIHLYMLGDSLTLWGGILQALVLGQ